MALRRPASSIAHVHRHATTAASANGWPVPSYSTMRAIVAAIDRGMLTLARDGPVRYRERFELVYRREAERPNQTWQADRTAARPLHHARPHPSRSRCAPSTSYSPTAAPRRSRSPPRQPLRTHRPARPGRSPTIFRPHRRPSRPRAAKRPGAHGRSRSGGLTMRRTGPRSLPGTAARRYDRNREPRTAAALNVRQGQISDASAGCDSAAHVTRTPMGGRILKTLVARFGNSVVPLRRREPGRSRLDSRDVRSAPSAIDRGAFLSVCGPLDGCPRRSAMTAALVLRRSATVLHLRAIGC